MRATTLVRSETLGLAQQTTVSVDLLLHALIRSWISLLTDIQLLTSLQRILTYDGARYLTDRLAYNSFLTPENPRRLGLNPPGVWLCHTPGFFCGWA